MTFPAPAGDEEGRTHQLDPSSEDAYVLRDTLEQYLSDLRMESADTDRLDFRDRLTHRKAILERISQALAPMG